MKQYPHIPLRQPWDGQRDIRTLTLSPGHKDEDVRISITNRVIPEDLADASAASIRPEPPWECLSYTWGDLEHSTTIFVESEDSTNGGSTELATLAVGQNLFAALKRLRYSDENRILWIDAICIDQSDTIQARQEKGHQIPAMLEIYQLATRVIIWLGEANDDSDFAMHFLQRLGESFEYNWTTYDMKPTLKLQRSTLQLLENWDPQFGWDTREYQAICNLLARGWFRRVWTRQEAFAGSGSSIVMCGSSSMALSEFRNAIQLVGVKGFDVRDPNSEENLDRLALAISVLDTQIGSYSTILDIMSTIREGECKLPQDKIYGCLGMIKLLVNKDFANSIPPDYPDAIELFKTFFLRYIQRYKTLRLLETGGLCQVSSLGGPSWLPDWTTRMSPLDQRLDLAVSHGMAPEVQYDGGDILTVTGVIATQVRAVDILKHTGDLSSANFGKSCEEIRRLAREHLSPGLDHQIHAFTRALTTPMNALRVPLENIEPNRRSHQNLVHDIIKTSDMAFLEREMPRDALNQFMNCIRHHQQHRTPFIFTEDGHVGTSVTGAEPGDCVAAVLGMNNLLLLRPSPTSHEDECCYKLVGLCSIHGLNWGEAFLGPLIAAFTVIPQLNGPVGNILPFFQNTETGESTFWDPRIDWTELDVKPTDGPSYKIRAPPGEPERHVPTADFFRRHGAKLRRIELI